MFVCNWWGTYSLFANRPLPRCSDPNCTDCGRPRDVVTSGDGSDDTEEDDKHGHENDVDEDGKPQFVLSRVLDRPVLMCFRGPCDLKGLQSPDELCVSKELQSWSRGKAKFVMCDADFDADIAEFYGIQRFPAFIFLDGYGNQYAKRETGGYPESSELVDLLAACAPWQAKEQARMLQHLKEAKAHQDKGENGEAVRSLTRIMKKGYIGWDMLAEAKSLFDQQVAETKELLTLLLEDSSPEEAEENLKILRQLLRQFKETPLEDMISSEIKNLKELAASASD